MMNSGQRRAYRMRIDPKQVEIVTSFIGGQQQHSARSEL